ncbi:MAG: hypothetical protein JW713_07505 [Pontiellaceae bacterium]|nr:hypothetical protein [Pontiellaceae bacterium]
MALYNTLIGHEAFGISCQALWLAMQTNWVDFVPLTLGGRNVVEYTLFESV